MKARYFGLILLLALICTPTMAVWSNTLNNGDITLYPYIDGGGTYGYSAIPGYLDTQSVYTTSVQPTLAAYWITPNASDTSNYFAYTTKDSPSALSVFGIFNSNRVQIGGYWNGAGAAGTDNGFHRMEAVRSGSTIYTYWDGTLNTTTLSVSTAPIYAFGFGRTKAVGGTQYFDDLSFGNSFSTTGLVSVMPHSWYIKSDMVDPSNFAMIDNLGNQVYSDHFDVQWSLGAYADGWQATQNPPDTRYKITIAAPDGSTQVYNQYIKISDYGAATGIVSIPMNNTYIGNYPLQYGLYWVTLYDGSAVKSQDYFYVLGTGASITMDKSAYTAGSTATATYSISSGYYDTATYNYEIKILDAYGNTLKTNTISGQYGTTAFQLDSATYPNGAYYAEIIAVQKSDNKEIAMNYAVFEVTSYVTVSGYVVDQNNNPISGATVNITQATSTLATTTSATGNYSSANNWLANIEMNMTTTMSGYEPDINKWTPLGSGDYAINVTLLSVNRTCSGICIDGVTRSRGTNTTIPSANTYLIANVSRTGYQTGTSNGAGYYQFAGLTNNTVYDVWSQKTGFSNSSVAQVTAVGV